MTQPNPIPWPPYGVLPSIVDLREAWLIRLRDESGTGDIVARWAMGRVLHQLMERALAAHFANPKRDKQAAEDAHFLERKVVMTAWRERFFVDPLREFGTKRDFDERCAVALWAVDQVVDHLNRVEATLSGPGAIPPVPRASAWRLLLSWIDQGRKPSWIDDDKRRAERIAHVSQGLKPDAAPRLMAAVLDEVTGRIDAFALR
jgi:hypothetical protein